MDTLNTFQQWQVANGHHVTENVDGDEFHAPELCPLCQDVRGTVHDTYVETQPSLTVHDANVYRALCVGCSWRGPWREDVFDADDDAHAHTAEQEA